MDTVSLNVDKLSKESLLHLLEKAYRSVCTSKGFYEIVFGQFDVLPLSPENQEKILSATANNCQVKKYPPPLSFRKFFLKKLLKEVENSGYEVSEELFVVYAHTLSEPSSNDSLWFYCYFINETEVVTIQENPSFVIKSTTGLRTWAAGKYFTEWCVENSHLFKNRQILELGSGTGLVGIAICKIVEPSVFIFTDKSPDVLRLISSNLQVNIPVVDSNDAVIGSDPLSCNGLYTINSQSSSCKISICHLEWEHFSDQQTVSLSPDIIIAADVVYDPAMVPHLVRAIHKFLSNGVQCAYIACTVRNCDTHIGFRNSLDSCGLKGEVLAEPEKLELFYDDTSCFKIYKICLL